MIPSRHIFDAHAHEYDLWFDEHPGIYETQQQMLRLALPLYGHGLEVGVGSGRFAVPLGIHYGIDPSRELVRMAKARGIEVVRAEGEHLPYRDRSFDYILMMTVICFLDNPLVVFREAERVLVAGGKLVTGFIEKDGEIARQYLHEKTKGRFLRFATFRTVDEVIRVFSDAGFSDVSCIRRAQGFCIVSGKTQ